MADEEKIIGVVIKYSTQGAEQAARTEKQLRDDIAADMEKLKKIQQDYAKGVQVNAQQEEQIMKTATANLKEYEDRFGQASQKIVAGQKAVNQELEKQAVNWREIKMQARDIGQIGTFLAGTGAAITAPLFLSAQNYVNTMGDINKQSAQWLKYQDEIKESNLRIGQTATQALLPTMKAASDIMDHIAGIAEKNPWLVQGVLAVGGAMTVLGVATRVIAELVKTIAEAGELITKATTLFAESKINSMGGVGNGEYLPGGAGPAALAGGSSLALLGSMVASILAVGAVTGAVKALVESIVPKSDKTVLPNNSLTGLGDPELRKKQVELANAISRNEDPEKIAKLREEIQKLGQQAYDSAKQIDKTADTVANQNLKSPSGQLINEQEVQAFIAFQKQKADAEKNYEQQRSDIVKQFGEQRAQLEATYEAQRTEIMSNFASQVATETRDFNQQQATAERNFNEQQAKALRDYQESVKKSEDEFRKQQKQAAQAHQTELKRLEQEHNSRMDELGAARDALGLVKEQRAYEQKVNQSNEDFSTQQQQAREQHRQQLEDQRAAFLQQQADARAAYEQQRADQQAAFDQRIADQRTQEQKQLAQLDAQHKLEMDKQDKLEKDKLNKLADAYKNQIELLQTAFIDRLRSIDKYVLGDYKAFQGYMESASLQFQQWLQYQQALLSSTTTTTTVPPLQPHYTSGYAPYGPYMLGDAPGGGKGMDEYVIGGSTTKALEQLLGNRITESGLLSAVMASRAPGPASRNINLTLNDQRSFSGDYTASMRKEIDRSTRQAFKDVLAEVQRVAA